MPMGRNITKILGASLVLTCILSACDPQKVPSNKGKFFDMVGLVDQQVGSLVKSQANLTKEAVIDGDTNQTALLMDSTQWAEALAFFKEGDINRPNLQDAYQVTEGLKDDKSNLLITTYNALNTAENGVTCLKVYYLRDPEKPMRVEAEIRENNLLYTAHKKLSMWFMETLEQEPVLIAYGLEGYQKIVLKDTIKFKIHNRVDYP